MSSTVNVVLFLQRMIIKDKNVFYFSEPARVKNSLDNEVLFRNNVSNDIVACQRVLRCVNTTSEYTTHALLHTCLSVTLT